MQWRLRAEVDLAPLRSNDFLPCHMPVSYLHNNHHTMPAGVEKT
jgi:hypothetical protein